MTHFDEAECVLYLDGQLGVQRAAELSAHAAICDDCRALLGVLEKESRLLGAALLEQDEPLPIRLREAPWAVTSARAAAPGSASWALWAWALSFGLAAAVALAL